MKPQRQRLVDSRNGLSEYAESLEKLHDDFARYLGVIRQLVVYPIKSLGGVISETVELTENGLKIPGTGISDRMAMLALKQPGKNQDGEYEYRRLSQREIPELMKIEVDAGIESFNLNNSTGSGPRSLVGVSSNYLTAVEEQEESSVLVGSEIIKAVKGPKDVTAWIREIIRGIPKQRKIAKNIELLLPPVHSKRLVEPEHSGNIEAKTLFSDGGQILVASEETLNWMNGLLRTQHGERFTNIHMDAFRPNIVIAGNIPPNIEDLVDELRIPRNDARLILTSLCVRCAVTQVNRYGLRSDKEPLKFLSKQRPARPNSKKPTFGVNAVIPEHSQAKIITVGDRFRITEKK